MKGIVVLTTAMILLTDGALPAHAEHASEGEAPMPPVAAQEASLLQLGTRVRIKAPTIGIERRVGQLTAIGPDTLYVAFRSGTSVQPVPFAYLVHLEVSRGRGSTIGGGARGAGLGLVAGVGVGALIGQFALQSSDCSDCLGAELGAAFGGGSGLVLGFLVGTAIPRERWRAVHLTK